ncbi:hypothetical protein HPB51_018823 [Rhipicephalus microplus]|uniref:Transposable element n=1 Tax=Rhipicephalus microplus TaxID=6941 RepID=A0A9J6DB24_RHIMP|nr:hypothetical protein HPB51_018823 [Rhipicephalus microplus]
MNMRDATVEAPPLDERAHGTACRVERLSMGERVSAVGELMDLAKTNQKIQGWSLEVVDASVVVYKLTMENAVPRVDKAVVVSRTLAVSVSANGRLVPSVVYAKDENVDVKTVEEFKCLLGGILCKYDYNQVALRCIEEHLNDKSHLRRCGVLLVDEIKLKQAVAFDKASYKMDGFVDYACGSWACTHLMYVPLFEDWVQPIATFATKGAAPGKVLSEIVISAVIQLHKHGASVLAIISDGAGNNCSMWSQLGISGKLDSARHFIEHPLEPSQNIYFICDIPHVIKCIRKHLKKHTYGMAGDYQINFQHYVTLYETEKNKQLRVVPKLTRAHVALDNLRKMRVRLVTQVIKDFLALLNMTERNALCSGLKLFASQMMTEAMRVTLLSTLDIIEYLFGQGAHYILTAKLNQDPLERHFGLVRSFGGDESHQTLVNFTRIFRLLSLYTPIKTALRGSVEGAPSAVLVGVQDTLRRTKENGDQKTATTLI